MRECEYGEMDVLPEDVVQGLDVKATVEGPPLEELRCGSEVGLIQNGT